MQTGKTVKAIIDDWNQIANLFDSIQSLIGLVQQQNDSQHFVIKSYNYKQLVFGYGPSHSATAIVTWNKKERRFQLGFSCSGQFNGHNIIREQLELFLNKKRDCGFLVRILQETFKPLHALAKLSSTLQPAVIYGLPANKFAILVHSPTHLRLIYRNKFCLEIRLASGGKVLMRDGAFSAFDKSELEGFSSIDGLDVIFYYGCFFIA